MADNLCLTPDVLPIKWSARNLSSTPSTDVSYDQLKQDLAGRTAVVIDVREPWELREYGTIPGSINVPRECIYLSNKCMMLQSVTVYTYSGFIYYSQLFWF